MAKLTLTFTGRNPFSNEEVQRGIEAAQAVFKRHGLTADEAWVNNMVILAAKSQTDPVWTEADYEACRAMCGSDDTTAAENATLEMVG